mmetsp:Transcript_5996/g.10025  ORF Transcript_5996/g.10025 Transcript_5996/m.10025 type:complete len:153 (+) Transcript_5996:68-526(+)
MAPFVGAPSRAEQIALVLMPKFAAFGSVLGSLYIIRDVLRIRRTKKSAFTTYHRLLVGLSVSDCLMSCIFLASTWPMPSDTPYVYGAVGNTSSCALFGCIGQSGVAAVAYNASLSTFYLRLKICYGWSERAVSQKAERWLHAVPISIGASAQ